MKKHVLIFLILVGFVFGCWLAQENRKLLETIGLIERPQEDIHERSIDMHRITIGMETWQVKQALGTPEKRNVEMATQDMKKEEWIYGKKSLYFTNGVLTSWKEW